MINQGYDPDIVHKVHDEMGKRIEKLEYENEKMLKSCLAFVDQMKDMGISEWSDGGKLREIIKQALKGE